MNNYLHRQLIINSVKNGILRRYIFNNLALFQIHLDQILRWKRLIQLLFAIFKYGVHEELNIGFLIRVNILGEVFGGNFSDLHGVFLTRILIQIYQLQHQKFENNALEIYFLAFSKQIYEPEELCKWGDFDLLIRYF